MSTSPQSRLDAKWDELQRVLGEYNALCCADGALAEVQDYTLHDFDGQPLTLSAAFGEHDSLLLVHNMGFACPYCTLWADGFNGIWRHFESGAYGRRCKFLLLSNDTPQQQRAGAERRGWSLPMLSCAGTTLFAELGFGGPDGHSWQPGASILQRQPGGALRRHAKTSFGPGDQFCSLFHFFALLPG